MSSTSSALAPIKRSKPKPGAWLSTIQQHFIEGRNCDVVVRVSIEQPSAKRMRADDGIATRNGASRWQKQCTVDIPCPSMILTARSGYFNAALNGVNVENQQKTVEVALADAQAVEDLKLLVKLSCGLSYVEDSGVRLPMSTRLRLAFLGNAFEFVECVQECLQSLSEEELTLEGAFTLLDEMPEELWEHEEAMAIRSKIITVFKEEVDKLSAQFKKRRAEPKAAVALAVRMNKVTKALVAIIEERCPRVHGMQEPTAAEKHGEQLLQKTGTSLCKALGKVENFSSKGLRRLEVTLTLPQVPSTRCSLSART